MNTDIGLSSVVPNPTTKGAHAALEAALLHGMPAAGHRQLVHGSCFGFVLF